MKLPLFFLCVSLLSLQMSPAQEMHESFHPHAFIPKKITLDPTPYILPKQHPLRPILNSLFPTADPLNSDETLLAAGFSIFRAQKASGIRIVSHPKLPGYLIKLYPTSLRRHRSSFSKQDWFIQRCRGAAQLRELIRSKNIQYFTVPDKWLYKVSDKSKDPQLILIVTKMNLVTEEETGQAWKTKLTTKHLDEFLLCMKRGGTSGALIINVPYTKEGKFAFIDTEYPDRIFSKEKLKTTAGYFSEAMGAYWNQLIDKDKDLK